MVEYDDLSDENKVLLEVEREEIMRSGDVSFLLCYCSLPYASNLLREIWLRHLLKRKKEKKKKGGIQYRYSLTEKGEKRVALLHEKGY